MSALTALRPVEGQGTWRHTPQPRCTQLTLLGTVVVCFALMGVFLLLLRVGHTGVCAMDRAAYGHEAHRYCEHYIPWTEAVR